MSYIIQRDDNGKDMLVEYDSGCGCCAGYRAINVTEADTFYDTKYLDHGKVAEAIREQIAVHQDSIRELQEFALNRFELLRWGLSPDLTPVESQMQAEDHQRRAEWEGMRNQSEDVPHSDFNDNTFGGELG